MAPYLETSFLNEARLNPLDSKMNWGDWASNEFQLESINQKIKEVQTTSTVFSSIYVDFVFWQLKELYVFDWYNTSIF
jgi:hypothetical protein